MTITSGSTRTYPMCPKKEKAREETILSTYGSLFSDRLPDDKQYWTMCSTHTNDDGSFSVGSELGQVMGAGLITPDQFYGVDVVDSIIDANKNAMPSANWIYDDFVSAMREEAFKGTFNPGIINADFISMHKKASRTVADIIELVTYADVHDVMVVANVMYNNPYANKRVPEEILVDDMLDIYLKYNHFKRAWSKGGWGVLPDFYCYMGTGTNSKTIMVSMIFFRTG